MSYFVLSVVLHVEDEVHNAWNRLSGVRFSCTIMITCSKLEMAQADGATTLARVISAIAQKFLTEIVVQ